MNRPIAIFDSGVGGLTVMREIASMLPNEEIVYLGDTARVPYGIKGERTIIRFTREIVRFLLGYNPKLVVVACNTASAVALPTVLGEFPVPILGVVEPSGRAAAERTRTGRIAVLATEATVNSNAYVDAIRAHDRAVQVFQKACPLLVPCVEEGRPDSSPVVRMVLAEYLQPVKAFRPDVVVLGCTHYPLLAAEVASQCGDGVEIVDSAHATAQAVVEQLTQSQQLRPGPGAKYHFLVTDNPERFQRIGGHFWEGQVRRVELVEVESFLEAAGDVV